MILVVYVILMAGVAVIGYVVVPSLVKEVQGLSRNAPAVRARTSVTTRHSGTTTTATTSRQSSCTMRAGYPSSSGTSSAR